MWEETAIEATDWNSSSPCEVVAEAPDRDAEEAGLGTPIAALAVAGTALTLMLLPTAVALHLAVPAGGLAAGIAVVGLGSGFVKLLFAAWGVAMRVRGLHQARVSPS